MRKKAVSGIGVLFLSRQRWYGELLRINGIAHIEMSRILSDDNTLLISSLIRPDEQPSSYNGTGQGDHVP
jgi:hypothetical protein